MKFKDCNALDEIFSHDPGEGKPIRHFNATKMFIWAHAIPGVEHCTINLDKSHAAFIHRMRGIEQWKLDRLKEPYLSLPLIIIEDEGGHVTVDGNHRYVKLVEMGREATTAFIFPKGTWENFLIEDFPFTDAQFKSLKGFLS